MKQLKKAIDKVREQATDTHKANHWISTVEHYRALLLKVVDQSMRRVFQGERVPACDKIVSLFEPHTDIIVKAKRDVQYGHKINLTSQADGFVTYRSGSLCADGPERRSR